MPKKKMTSEESTRWVTESRAAQGLPPTIKDPVTLAKIAVILRAAELQPRRDKA